MTNNQHGQVPEALIDLIDAYAETRHRCGGIYNAKTEAARNAVIEALSGVQALSAAPAIGDELRDTLVAVSAAIAERDDRAAQKMICEILAASPTPPAEQQAQPGAVYAELPQPDSWFHFTAQFWENKLRDFADRTHALRMEQVAPKAAPLQQEWRLVLPGGKHTDEWESARVGDYNRGWNDYRKAAIAALNSVVWPARASGNWVAASTWLRNNYQDYPNITSLCDAMLEAAPQQEAPKAAPGEPAAIKMVGYGGCTGINDYLMSDGTIKTMRPHEVVWREAPQQAVAGGPVANDIHGALTAAAIYLTNAQRQYGKDMHRQAIASLEKAKRAVAQAADFAKAAPQQEAPKAAPGEQNTAPAEWLEQAYREGWAACRDAETIGEEAEDWAFGNSTANSRMIDAQQAAPQPAPAELERLRERIARMGLDVDRAMRGHVNEQSPLGTQRLAAIAALAKPAPAPLSEREAFERDWEKRHAPVPINGRTHDDGRYGDSSIQDAWERAKAAALAAQGGK